MSLTPKKFRHIRTKILKLKPGELQQALNMTDTSGRHVRRIENGKTNVTGPMALLMEHYFPNDDKYIDQFRKTVD